MYFRSAISACSIEEEHEVTITGGYSKTLVTRYKMNGDSEALPRLKIGRYLHACGRFTNSDGDIVSYFRGKMN